MKGESHTRNWVKPAVGVCLLAIAGIGLMFVDQITIKIGIRKFNNAVLAKDCSQIEQSARVLTGIFQYGVDDAQSNIVADALGQCKLLAGARLSLESDEYLAAQT
jgi:hypothetical protein